MTLLSKQKDFTVYQLGKPMTFMEMAAEAVGQTGDETTLSRLLIEKGLTMTKEQTDAILVRLNNEEDMGLDDTGKASFVFLNENGSVSGFCFYRRDGQWCSYFEPLESDYRWNAEYRLLLRNSDAPEPSETLTLISDIEERLATLKTLLGK